MKTRLFIGMSAALNLALGIAIFLPVKKPPAPGPPAPEATPIVATITQRPLPANGPPDAAVPFRWDQVASSDPKIYRDNLQAIGCPVLTTREIIRAVINEFFRPRRQAILASFQDHYWDLVMRRQLNPRQSISRTEWGQALALLTTEREKLMAEVLGGDDSAPPGDEQTPRADLERRLAWLPPEKRERLIALEENHQQRLKELTESRAARANEPPTADDQDRLQKLQYEFENSEKQLLTPEELSELRLSESPVAGWAASLPGFNPNEDQWRTLTELRAQYEEIKATNTYLANGGPAAQNELQNSFTDAVKDVLDPGSFAQYQLANDDQYQAFHSVTERYGLPDSVASQALDVQQAAQAQAGQMRANSDLSPDDQQAELNLLQQQTEQNLGQILGADVLATYKEYGGDWINGLSQLNK